MVPTLSNADEANKGSYAQLEQSLVAPEENLATTTATPMFEVVAPATLPEGYLFDVKMGENTFQVKVPLGGVSAGQKFMVPMTEASSALQGLSASKINVPVGHWKDGLCECFRYGPLHNHCLLACFCPLVGAGQVISRLKLTFWGTESNTAVANPATFHLCVLITICYLAVYILLILICSPYDDQDDYSPEYRPEPPQIIGTLMLLRDGIHYAFLVLLFYILTNLRAYVRRKYAIPEDQATGCEDLMCSVCCAHLTVAQILRHTTDYEMYNATCCTATGIPVGAPAIV